MTLTEGEVEAPRAGDPAPSAAPPRPGRRVAAAVAVAALALVLAAAGAREAVARGRLAQVHVVAGADAVDCGDAPVGVQGTDLGGTRIGVAAIEVRPDLRCRFRFFVRNDGDGTVELTRVRFPGVGPGRHGLMTVDAVDPLGVAPDAGRSDASFRTRLALPPHSAVPLTLQLVIHPEGCIADGTLMYSENQPTVTVRALGVSRAHSLRGIPFGLHAGTVQDTFPGCRQGRP